MEQLLRSAQTPSSIARNANSGSSDSHKSRGAAQDAAQVHLEIGRRIFRGRLEVGDKESESGQRKEFQKLVFISTLVFGEAKARFLLPWKRVFQVRRLRRGRPDPLPHHALAAPRPPAGTPRAAAAPSAKAPPRLRAARARPLTPRRGSLLPSIPQVTDAQVNLALRDNAARLFKEQLDQLVPNADADTAKLAEARAYQQQIALPVRPPPPPRHVRPPTSARPGRRLGSPPSSR